MAPTGARVSTITDVAREAGVSVATVSRALRGLDRVSPSTREKVLEAARRLHYVASPTATSLASGRTRVVAVVAPFLTRWFFATLVSAIEKELRRTNHHVLLIDLEDDSPYTRLHLTQEMLSRRVDGLITLNVPMADEEITLLDRLGLPAVAIGERIPGRPLVCIDDSAAGRAATEHLIGLGHRDIGYIGTVPVNAAHVHTPATRLAAFRATMRAHRLTVRDDWVIDSDWTAQSAHIDALRLLARPDRPTAIVAASDEMAIGVIVAAQQLGVGIPNVLSIIGIDDFTLSDVMGLTTVRQDVLAQGEEAARTLMRALLGGEPAGDRTTIIPTDLIVRASTGPPPRRRDRPAPRRTSGVDTLPVQATGRLDDEVLARGHVGPHQ